MSTPAGTGSKLPFHTWDVETTFRHFATNGVDGLSKVDAASRLEKYGTNELTSQGGVSKWTVFVAQLSNSMTIVLLLAFVISMAIRDWVEAGVIMVVIVTNTIIGFIQEYRAEKTMESLRNLTSPTALVIREGSQHHIPALQVVPGDIIQFKDGDVIPADLRLFEVFNLEIDEALLTGESAPVAKTTTALKTESLGAGDRVNLAYSSTVVTKGRGRGVVVCTGMASEMGQIAKALSHKGGADKTVLQTRVDQMALRLLAFAVVLALIVFAVNRFDIKPEVALYAISLAIAVIPEGLVAVMTITMAVSVRAMAKQKAIVRKLNALEAIGQVSNICSDKTGTITQGRMVLSKIHLPGVGNFSVTGEGYNPIGEIKRVRDPGTPKAAGANRLHFDSLPLSKDEYPEQLISLARVGALCNQAELRHGTRLPATSIVDMSGAEKSLDVTVVETSDNESRPDAGGLVQEKGCDNEVRDGGWKAFGDPTECAIQVFATKIGMGKPDLIGDYELIAEFAFESAIKRASVIVRHKSSREVYVLLKGATEQVMSKCNGVDQAAMLCEMERLATDGLRVLAFAERKVSDDLTDEVLRSWKREDADKDMTMIGLVGIFDPPRPQSKGAIQACARAGISVHMLTGDHPKTAAAIALSVGLISRAEAKATPSSSHSPSLPAPTAPGTGLELFRSITMAAEEQPTANMVMTAQEFDALTDREIDRLAHLPKVIARCAPHTKTRMVEALHRRQKVVAMTGDGVNDAPSLKASDVGIAMGLAGSDVAKQASDIVLTNDNFATITKAVFEGRRIFDNIQKFILHLMSTNVAEVILLVVGLSFMARNGEEFVSIYPMSPVQILWLNMVTSSPPAMGLGFEKAESYLQTMSPRPKSKGLFGRELLADIFVYGALMGLLALTNWILVIYAFGDGVLHFRCNSVSYEEAQNGGNIPGGALCNNIYRARATVFLSLILMILLHAVNCRRTRHLGFIGVLRNKFLLWSIIFGSVISVSMVYIPGTELIFQHAPIYATEWGVVIISNVVFVALSILYKLLKQAFMKPLALSEEDLDQEEDDEDDEDDYSASAINRAIG